MATLYSPQIVISAAPGITDYLYMELYEATAPNTPVANSGQLAPPHLSSRQLQFTNLNPVVHLVKLFLTDGLTTAGPVIANFSIDPKYPGVQIKVPWHVYADTTPGFDSGTSTFFDPTGELTGWNYEVEIRGYGTMDDGSTSGNQEIDTTGPGYTVVNPAGYQFQPGEHHVIRFSPKTITLNSSANTSGSLFAETIILDSDTALIGDDYGKLFLLESATSTLNITLPLIDTAPANRVFFLNSDGGNHKNVTIAVNGTNSEKIYWNGQLLDEIILGQCEYLWLTKWIDPNNSSVKGWKVVNGGEGTLKVGELVDHYSPTSLNIVPADGSLLDRDVYPRLWKFAQTLEALQVVNDSHWADLVSGTAYTDQPVYKGHYSDGDGLTTFRVPLLTQYGFTRATDPNLRLAGTFQYEEIGQHTHPSPFKKNDSGGGNQQNTVYDGLDNGGTGTTTKIPVDPDVTENRTTNTAVYRGIRC